VAFSAYDTQSSNIVHRLHLFTVRPARERYDCYQTYPIRVSYTPGYIRVFVFVPLCSLASSRLFEAYYFLYDLFSTPDYYSSVDYHN
jgi:hypothetical protein